MHPNSLRLFVVVLMVTLMTGCQQDSPQEKINDNIKIKSSGQWTLVNVWAIWCAPCREEIPELNVLASRGDIRLIGADFDQAQGDLLQKKIANLGIAFPTTEENPFQVLDVAVTSVLPVTFVLNPQGELVDSLYGPQTADKLRTMLQRLKKEAMDG